ncbi:hypothetical protein AHF37_07489 [Paragonimus kellicotti]|nr:hypothetical protein AHF37_07489 [Paragonimus kellicotti]
MLRTNAYQSLLGDMLSNDKMNAEKEFRKKQAINDLLLNPEFLAGSSEEVRMAILLSVINFMKRNTEHTLTFPSSLTASERAFGHLVSGAIGLGSKSIKLETKGSKSLIIFRSLRIDTDTKLLRMSLTWNSKRSIAQLMQMNPLTAKERLELHLRTDGSTNLDRGNREERQRGTTGRLMGSVPQVPPATVGVGGISNSYPLLRSTIPTMYTYRSQLIQYLDKSQMVIVSGPPGCGKTTCLPQLQGTIMDDFCANLFHGHDFQLVSPKTLLTFCTHGVLLRTIYADSSLMAGTTHILVDEIDEDELPVKTLIKQRKVLNSTNTSCTGNTKIDISTELTEMNSPNEGCGILLSVIPSLLTQFPHLKVVLMVNLHKSTHDSWFAKRSVNVVSPNSAVPTFTNIADTPKNVSFHSAEQQHQMEADLSNHSSVLTDIITHSQPNTTCQSLNLIAASNAAVHSMGSSLLHTVDPTFKGVEMSKYVRTKISPDGYLTVTTARIPLQVNSPQTNTQLQSSQCPATNFDEALVLTIPYPEQNVKVYHLEDVLQWTGYWNQGMEEASGMIMQGLS